MRPDNDRVRVRHSADGEIADTIAAGGSVVRDRKRAHGGTATGPLVFMVLAALVIAGAATLVWPSVQGTQLATAAAVRDVTPRAGPRNTCAGQTWPYIDKGCLRSRAE